MFELSDEMNDEDLAYIVEDFFSPERLAERKQEAKEFGTKYLYLGAIERDENGEWHKFRVFPDKDGALDEIYEIIRHDEQIEMDYIASFADPRCVKQLGDKFSPKEIKMAEKRLDEFKELSLIDEIKSTKKELKRLEKELDLHRKKMKAKSKINPELTPEEAVEVSDSITEVMQQTKEDFSKEDKRKELDDSEKDDGNR